MIGRVLFILLVTYFHSFSQDSNNERVALVIGVQSYIHVSPLRNSRKDALDISSSLKRKGFQVIELIEPKTKREIQDAIRTYYKIISSDKGKSGLIYYSGHGMQVDGVNYLIPTDANPEIKADLDDQCVRMDFIMRALEQAGNSLNILIMDACRNNPFRSFSRSSERGLSMVNAPNGSYIVYSTKPGTVASDGTGDNGLFTSKLLKYLEVPGLSIEQVFKLTARDVSKDSNDKQRPWIASDYTGDFYFIPVGDAQINLKVEEVKSDIETFSDKSEQEIYELAIEEYRNLDFNSTLNYLLIAANRGHAPSQLKLGEMYHNGEGVERNYGSSFYWFEKAAVQGLGLAQYQLAKLYYRGEGIESDFEKAFEWFYKAAKIGIIEAEYEVAIHYEYGRGVEESEMNAVKWYTIAAEHGHLKSQNKLGELYLMGSGNIKRNKSEAIKWFRKAADQGDEWAQETLETLGVKY